MNAENGELKRTPLYRAHLAAGGRLVPFGGWEMPVQYSGINAEHRAVRSRVGVFDISHMGQIEVGGADGLAFLQYLFPGNIAQLEMGKVMYSVMCNERGGVIDDLAVYRLDEKKYLLVVNASRISADLEWVEERSTAFTAVEIGDVSLQKGMLAVQGPQAEELLADLLGNRVRAVAYYCSFQDEIDGMKIMVSRTGYTGEDGFEVICPAEQVGKMWHRIIEAGATPCGLGARDTLRTEMGYSLYGRELNEESNPLEAGLGWVLKLDKEEDFVGKQALLALQKEGKYRRRVGFKMSEKGIPRPQYSVCNEAGEQIGVVTSGTQSPTLEMGIGLARVEREARKRGTNLLIDMRGKLRRAEVVRLPFVPSRVKR